MGTAPSDESVALERHDVGADRIVGDLERGRNLVDRTGLALEERENLTSGGFEKLAIQGSHTATVE